MKQNMRPTANKLMDSFSSFSGGMNTVTSNENIRDHELALLINADVATRGAVSRRTGMSMHSFPVGSGKPQGYFRYWKSGVLHSELTAIGGFLYRNGSRLAITGLPNGFQSTRPIESVQYAEKMYIATGTKLVEYDGATAKIVDAYRPQPLEALYVGTNSLADNPEDFMTDGVSVAPRLDGLTFNIRYGIVNQPITMTAYVSLPPGFRPEYKFERRFPNAKVGEYLITQNWSSVKSCTFVTSVEGDYEIHVLLRDANDPTYVTEIYDEVKEELVPTTYDKIKSEYYVPKYKVKPVVDPADLQLSTPTVQTCNRIFLHWDRLYLYGDPSNANMLYFSHLKSPAYFPTSANLLFEEGKGESLTKIVPFRGSLVCFTTTTIQYLTGTNGLDFVRKTLNKAIGCPYPETAKVMGNYVVFLALDGLHILKTMQYTDDQANVQRIDSNVSNLVQQYANNHVCAGVANGQYHLVFPDSQVRLRYYYEQGVWVMDESPSMKMSRLYTFDGNLYGEQADSGLIVYFDSQLYNDLGYAYPFKFETKHHDFYAQYNPKKMKALQLLADKRDTDESVQVYVHADATRIWNVAEEDITSDRSMWTIGKVYYDNGSSEVYKMKMRGKGRTVKLTITQSVSQPFKVYGYGFQYKLKAPK